MTLKDEKAKPTAMERELSGADCGYLGKKSSAVPYWNHNFGMEKKVNLLKTIMSSHTHTHTHACVRTHTHICTCTTTTRVMWPPP